jgi:hypothetical protein
MIVLTNQLNEAHPRGLNIMHMVSGRRVCFIHFPYVLIDGTQRLLSWHTLWHVPLSQQKSTVIIPCFSIWCACNSHANDSECRGVNRSMQSCFLCGSFVHIYRYQDYTIYMFIPAWNLLIFNPELWSCTAMGCCETLFADRELSPHVYLKHSNEQVDKGHNIGGALFIQ